MRLLPSMHWLLVVLCLIVGMSRLNRLIWAPLFGIMFLLAAHHLLLLLVAVLACRMVGFRLVPSCEAIAAKAGGAPVQFQLQSLLLVLAGASVLAAITPAYILFRFGSWKVFSHVWEGLLVDNVRYTALGLGALWGVFSVWRLPLRIGGTGAIVVAAIAMDMYFVGFIRAYVTLCEAAAILIPAAFYKTLTGHRLERIGAI